ncbi:hypothetical protein HUN01_29175 [Nostoc edaphicum CCNP1411]|uniref:Uncharacterized protein n=1 Tax=Nostoc edaphicum CCNP1411 TaxID=1472755 RepID=A0A7D7LEJ2_9NOSO|nr:hypothetical protein [Nostoc edaphicum]QMS91473.1 hypothetical protein HUN01_29175 [Nostoc edaphicum CCNP1411]
MKIRHWETVLCTTFKAGCTLEEEFRIQKSEWAKRPATANRSQNLISRGFRAAQELLHHQIYDLVGVLNPVIQTQLENTRLPPALSTSHTENIAEF